MTGIILQFKSHHVHDVISTHAHTSDLCRAVLHSHAKTHLQRPQTWSKVCRRYVALQPPTV